MARIDLQRHAMMGERKRGDRKRSRIRATRRRGQCPHAAPSFLRLLENDRIATSNERVGFHERDRRFAFAFDGQARGVLRTALPFHRTNGTARRPGDADGRAQVHQRGIKFAGTPFRNERPGGRPKRVAPAGGIDRQTDIEKSRNHARGICLDHGNALIECERSNGVSDVFTNAGKLLDLSDIARKSFVFRDESGAGVKISRSRIVAEALPRVQDVVDTRSTQGREGGKVFHPFFEVGNDRRHLRLLKHDFRDEHRVRITRSAPREIAAMFPKPTNKVAAKHISLGVTGWFGAHIVAA